MTFCRHFIEELFKASGKSAAETSSVMHSGDLQRSSLVPELGEEISSFHLGKCRSGSSCDHLILDWQPASLPGDICLTGRWDPPVITIIPRWLGAGQQGPFSFNPECLHFREVFKAEWKTQQGNGGVIEPRSVSSISGLFLGYRWGCPLSSWGYSQSFS